MTELLFRDDAYARSRSVRVIAVDDRYQSRLFNPKFLRSRDLLPWL